VGLERDLVARRRAQQEQPLRARARSVERFGIGEVSGHELRALGPRRVEAPTDRAHRGAAVRQRPHDLRAERPGPADHHHGRGSSRRHCDYRGSVREPRPGPGIGRELTVPQQLACALRILAHEGWRENLSGHITWATPDGGMWCNPWGLWWDEVRASDIL